MMTSGVRPEIGEEGDLQTLFLLIYLLTTCLIAYLLSLTAVNTKNKSNIIDSAKNKAVPNISVLKSLRW